MAFDVVLCHIHADTRISRHKKRFDRAGKIASQRRGGSRVGPAVHAVCCSVCHIGLESVAGNRPGANPVGGRHVLQFQARNRRKTRLHADRPDCGSATGQQGADIGQFRCLRCRVRHSTACFRLGFANHRTGPKSRSSRAAKRLQSARASAQGRLILHPTFHRHIVNAAGQPCLFVAAKLDA